MEYTDYQCPYCNRFHTNALKAAQVARCAADQGKFWEMHDLLSANPNSLGPEAYANYARDLGLDAGSFKACIESDKHITDIRESGKGAAGIGITGTPSLGQ